MDKKGICLTLGIMCLALTYGLCMQVKTVGNYGSTVGGTSIQNELKEEILKVKERYDNLYEELEAVNEEIEIERTSATKNNTELEELEKEITEMNKLLGLTDTKGKGVKILLKDSNILASNYLGDPNDLIIHDKDIMHIVNELFNAGAEAVSVNDIRIVATSAIECNGTVIKIGGEKIGSPFEIKAIGYPELLANLKRPGGRLEKLENRGIIVSFSKEDNIEIPKYINTYKLNYIETN